MYDNFYPGRGFGGAVAGNSFGPGWFLGMSLLGGLFLLLVLVSLAIKGFALWHAAKRGEKWWFIALLLINTLGLLELVYLVFFAKVWFQGCCKGMMGNKTCAHCSHCGKKCDGKCEEKGKTCDHEDCDCGDCEKCKKTDH